MTKSNGVLAVAILTTPAFDATNVDPSSVLFGPGSATEVHGHGHWVDVDDDGDIDLVLHFKTSVTGITCNDTKASLTGQTLNGIPIRGSDSFVTAGCPRQTE